MGLAGPQVFMVPSPRWGFAVSRRGLMDRSTAGLVLELHAAAFDIPAIRRCRRLTRQVHLLYRLRRPSHSPDDVSLRKSYNRHAGPKHVGSQGQVHPGKDLVGVDFHGLSFLRFASRAKPFGRTATIGRQGLHLDRGTVGSVLDLKQPFGPFDLFCEELLLDHLGASTVSNSHFGCAVERG